jgi:hypothetical protein
MWATHAVDATGGNNGVHRRRRRRKSDALQMRGARRIEAA